MQTLGERATWLRKVANLNQRQLVGLLKLKSVAHVSLIESRDGKKLSAVTGEAYCRVFGVTTAWLLRGEGDPPKEESVKIAAARAQGARDQELATQRKAEEERFKTDQGFNDGRDSKPDFTPSTPEGSAPSHPGAQ